MNSTNGSSGASLAASEDLEIRVETLAATVAAKGYRLTALSLRDGLKPVGLNDRYALQAPTAPPQNWWQCTNWYDLAELERLVAGDGMQDADAFVAVVKACHAPRQHELQL